MSSRRPREKGCRTFPSALGAVLDLGEKLRFHPYAAMGDPLGVRPCFADERRQALAQIGSRLGVEAVVDLAGIDKVPAPAAGQIDAVPFLAIEGKAGDGQRLALLAGFFDPDVAATGDIG